MQSKKNRKGHFAFSTKCLIETRCSNTDIRVPPAVLPWPSDHLKLQVGIANPPQRISSPPCPPTTFDLVSLTDTYEGNMTLRETLPSCFQTLFVAFAVKPQEIMGKRNLLFLLWHFFLWCLAFLF